MYQNYSSLIIFLYEKQRFSNKDLVYIEQNAYFLKHLCENDHFLNSYWHLGFLIAVSL